MTTKSYVFGTRTEERMRYYGKIARYLNAHDPFENGVKDWTPEIVATFAEASEISEYRHRWYFMESCYLEYEQQQKAAADAQSEKARKAASRNLWGTIAAAIGISITVGALTLPGDKGTFCKLVIVVADFTALLLFMTAWSKRGID